MAKGPIITTAIEQLIIKTHLEKPAWRAKEIREEVNAQLRKNDPSISPGWPSLSTVQKVLARIHKKERESPPDPEDAPWSVSDLTQYPIPPEVLPAVLRAWADALEMGTPLTIRQVRWAARLYYVIKESGFLDGRLLATMARKYAFLEKTIMFLAANDKLSVKEQKQWLLWHDDSILYYFMAKDDRPIGKVVKKMKHTMPYMLGDWDEEKRYGIEALEKMIESS